MKRGDFKYFSPILFLGIFLFTFKLESIPSAVYSDEAVVGYNAYSILTTGRDEFGQKLPILFKFFGTYTPGLAVYLQTILVGLLGLNSFSIRLLSVISMLVLLWVIYRQWGKIAAWLAVISPWVVFNARIGYETTLAAVMTMVGTMMYQNPKWSFGLISLSMYAGFSSRYLAPLLIGLIYICFYRGRKNFKKIKLPLVLALVIQIPNLALMTTPAFWSKSGNLTANFLAQYVSYFSPANLFSRGDYDLQRSMPLLAVFYGWMFVPWVVGWYVVYKNRNKILYRYLVGLALLMPIPAAMADTNFSTQRALPMLLPYIILMTLGMRKILGIFWGKTKVVIIVGLTAFSLLLLCRSYFILFPGLRAKSWDYGYEQLAKLIKENPNKHFVVDNSRGVPGANLLFYLGYPPSKYQKTKQVRNYYQEVGFDKNLSFGNVEVRAIDWKNDICKEQILVGDDLAISEGQTTEHFLVQKMEIRDKLRRVLLQAYETDPKKKCGKT